MITTKTLQKFAVLISAINKHETVGKSYKKALSPEVTSQVDAIEKCLYGLLDRIAYAHMDRYGKPIHLDSKTAKAYLDTVKAVRENEGEFGNSDEHWFNILSQCPEGTLDGVLKVEHDVAERVEAGHPEPEVVDKDGLRTVIDRMHPADPPREPVVPDDEGVIMTANPNNW